MVGFFSNQDGFLNSCVISKGFPGGDSGKEPACQCKRCKSCGFDPWVRKIPWGGGMVTHSSIFAWRIPGTEEPGGLQSVRSQRVGHDWSDLVQNITAQHHKQWCHQRLWPSWNSECWTSESWGCGCHHQHGRGPVMCLHWLHEGLSPRGPACHKTCHHSVIKMNMGEEDVDGINLNLVQDAENLCVSIVHKREKHQLPFFFSLILCFPWT